MPHNGGDFRSRVDVPPSASRQRYVAPPPPPEVPREISMSAVRSTVKSWRSVPLDEQKKDTYCDDRRNSQEWSSSSARETSRSGGDGVSSMMRPYRTFSRLMAETDQFGLPLPSKSLVGDPNVESHRPSAFTAPSPRAARRTTTKRGRKICPVNIFMSSNDPAPLPPLPGYGPVARSDVLNLLADDDAIRAEAEHPISSLPFLSTQEVGVGSFRFDGNASGSPLLLLALQQSGSASAFEASSSSNNNANPTARGRSANVSPTRRYGKVIMHDEVEGGLLFDQAGVFVVRFYVEDLVLHSVALNIGDILSYNRVRESEDKYRGVRLIRHRAAELNSSSPKSVKEALNGSPWIRLDDGQQPSNGALLPGEDGASMSGIEYRTAFARSDPTCITSLENVGSINENQNQHQQPVNHMRSTTHLIKEISANPKLLLRDVEREVDFEYRHRSAGAASGEAHGSTTHVIRSMFEIAENRASDAALEEFLSSPKTEQQPVIKKELANNKWYVAPAKRFVDNEHDPDDEECTSDSDGCMDMGEDESTSDTDTSYPSIGEGYVVDGSSRNTRNTKRNAKHSSTSTSAAAGGTHLVSGEFEAERRLITSTTNIRNFVEGVVLEPQAPKVHKHITFAPVKHASSSTSSGSPRVDGGSTSGVPATIATSPRRGVVHWR